MKMKRGKSFASRIMDNSPELEAIQNDFREITKQVLILKNKFDYLKSEDVTSYLADNVNEAKRQIKSITDFLSI